MSIDVGGRAVIEGGCIVVRVPIAALGTVVEVAWMLNALDTRWKVTDPEAFAKALVREFNSEDEQGTTPVHKAFDAAINEAIEQGAEGIEEHEDQEGNGDSDE